MSGTDDCMVYCGGGGFLAVTDFAAGLKVGAAIKTAGHTKLCAMLCCMSTTTGLALAEAGAFLCLTAWCKDFDPIKCCKDRSVSRESHGSRDLQNNVADDPLLHAGDLYGTAQTGPAQMR